MDGVLAELEVLDEQMPVAPEVTHRPEGHKDREFGALELVFLAISSVLEVLVLFIEGHALPVSRGPLLVCPHIVVAELDVLVEGLKMIRHFRRHDMNPLFMRMGRYRKV